MEKIHNNQQKQIASLQAELQYADANQYALARFVQSLITMPKGNLDVLHVPYEVQRILQQFDMDVDKTAKYKRNTLAEGKLAKSVSMSSQLGFTVNILKEDANECEELENQSTLETQTNTSERKLIDTGTAVNPSNTHNKRPSSLPYQVHRSCVEAKCIVHSPTQVDSGMGTPLSSPSAQNMNSISASTF